MKKLIILGMFLQLAIVAATELLLPHFDKAPVIDGKVSAEKWKQGFHAQLQCTGKASPLVTDVWLGRDQKNLYVAFLCKDPSISTIKATYRTPEERDNAIWTDDFVELRFDPWNAPKELLQQRQIIVNANGIVYDAIGKDKKKNFSCHVRTSSDKDSWCVELSVPISDLTGYIPGQAELWRIGLARFNPRTKEAFTLTGDNAPGFGAPTHFLTFRSGNKHPFTVVSLANNSLDIRGESTLSAPVRFTLTQLKQDGTPTGRSTRANLRKAGKTVSLVFTVRKDAKTIQLASDNGYRLEWVAPQVNGELFRSVSQTKNPLYKELTGKKGPGLVRNVSPMWRHGFQESSLSTAIDYAIPWSLCRMMQVAHDENLQLLGGDGMLEAKWSNLPGIAPKGTTYTVTTQYYGYESVPVPKGKDGRPMLLDPQAEELWLKNFSVFFTPYKEHIRAVTFGDEQAEATERRFFQVLDQKEHYPFLQKMCEDIKNNYGYGKFGPPESPADTNPFRWIAFRSYLNAQLIRLHKALKQRMQKEFPGALLISDDPMGGQSKIYDFADFTPDACDIIAHQLFPENNAQIADFSFISKYLRDLAPVQEIHPCFHVENYGAAYTPEETIEKISQGIRAGANGFQWYLADTAGARSGRSLECDFYGAPERWKTEMAVLREMRSLNVLEYPKADTGVFVSTATLRAYPGMDLHPRKTQMLHSFLEIQGGVWFRYFNETSLQRKYTDLSQFKAIFVPDAEYCLPEAMNALIEYTKQGGTLVILDPNAFTCAPSSDILKREQIPGLKGMQSRAYSSRVSNGKVILPLVRSPQWNLTPAKESTVLFTYQDGKPAIISTKFGKGAITVFGFNIADREYVTTPEWQKWSRGFFKEMGLELDQKIWRFRFPLSLCCQARNPHDGKCLTGNYLFFNNFMAYTGANAKMPSSASYTCTPAPDAPAESAQVPFSKGKLTDRGRAYRAGNSDGNKTSVEERMVGWSTTKPIEVSFDLGQPATVGRIDLFYQGTMRDIVLSTSSDGINWKEAMKSTTDKAQAIKMGVEHKVLQLPSTVANVQYVKIRFEALQNAAPIAEGQELPGCFKNVASLRNAPSLFKANLQLMEIEIWDK